MTFKLLQASFALIVAFSVTQGHAAVIYNNTSNDALETINFADGPYTQIGDAVHLDGTERLLSQATVQFYNAGGQGSFDATLQFYLSGVPVGAPWGGGYTLTGISAPAASVFDVAFSNLALSFPDDDLVFTIEISNVDSATLLGLNLFNPPNSKGSSSSSFLITADSQGQFAETPAGTNSNLYFQLDADGAQPTIPVSADVPEPSTWLLTGTATALLLLRRRLRR